MPSIHSVAQIQHRKQEKIEIIERKFKEILEKDYGNQSSYKNTEARNHELETLMSQMESWFDIPFLLEDAKKETSPKCLSFIKKFLMLVTLVSISKGDYCL